MRYGTDTRLTRVLLHWYSLGCRGYSRLILDNNEHIQTVIGNFNIYNSHHLSSFQISTCCGLQHEITRFSAAVWDKSSFQRQCFSTDCKNSKILSHVQNTCFSQNNSIYKRKIAWVMHLNSEGNKQEHCKHCNLSVIKVFARNQCHECCGDHKNVTLFLSKKDKIKLNTLHKLYGGSFGDTPFLLQSFTWLVLSLFFWCQKTLMNLLLKTGSLHL